MIRPFSLTDLDRILQIEALSFPKSPYDGMTFVGLHRLHPQSFWVYVEKGNRVEEDQIVGYIVFSPEGHILSIAVHPQRRRRGIGKRFIEEAIRRFHFQRLWAEVRRSNEGAQTFYLKLGFKIVDEIPKYYGNEDALIVVWFPSACTSDSGI
ncbi:MAG: GNAT family N-acetyltransferase [Thermodesulfobacteriota bacterium]